MPPSFADTKPWVAHLFALHVNLPSEQVAIELLQARPSPGRHIFKVHWGWVVPLFTPLQGYRISLGHNVLLDSTTCQS